VTDKFGNPVAITDGEATDSSGNGNNVQLDVTYDGPGFVTTNLPTSTNAAGQFTVRVLLSQGEAGPAVLSVFYDPNDGSGVTTGELNSSAAVWVGPIANATAGAAKGRVVVDIYRAKGKSYTVLVGKTVVATGKANKANFRAVVRGVKSGDRNVTVRLTGGTNFKGAITVK
jgi:hypothetical protein